MNLIAPAKINLMLHFVGRRADNYHLMQSAVAFANIGDELVIEPAEDFSLTVTGPFASMAPADHTNLVARAAAGAKVAIKLVKNIPAGAGLGGGSADAAATLRALHPDWRESQLQDVALSLGSDVPVSLKRTAQWIEGIGKAVSDLPMKPMDAVLIWPGTPLATPAMYETYRKSHKLYHPVMPRPLEINNAFLQHTGNDFTDIAIMRLPVISNVLRDLAAQSGCVISRLSGSGSACFGIYKNEAAAKKAAENMSAAYPDAWVRPCVLNGL